MIQITLITQPWFSIGCFFEDFLVIEDHEANGVNQLTVKKGDVVRVIKKEETGVVKYCFHCVRVCMISKLIDTYHAQLYKRST